MISLQNVGASGARRMIEAVLDASAVLAVLLDEPGKSAVLIAMPTSVLSSVNAAEVATRLLRGGVDAEVVHRAIFDFGCPIIPVDTDLALRSAALWGATSAKGLSLGDRICLALAEREGASALTANRAWADLGLDIPITLIR